MRECFSKTNAEFISGFKYTFGTREGLKGFAFGTFILSYMVGVIIATVFLIKAAGIENPMIGLPLFFTALVFDFISMVYFITVYDHCNPKPKKVTAEDVGG